MRWDWFPWVRDRKRSAADILAAEAQRDELAEVQRAHVLAEVARVPYRIDQHPDGSWLVERSYRSWKPYPLRGACVAWEPLAVGLATEAEAWAAIERHRNPIKIEVGPDGCKASKVAA